MTTVDTDPPGELREFAFTKIANVLGPDRARALLRRLVDDPGHELRTPNDLLRLSERMAQLGGFEGAVGAMLGVAAVVRGATPGGE